jgi:DNA-binding NtrC family response regulator
VKTMAHTKILVVDQDQVAYEPLKPGLSKHGYEMHTAVTVKSALALAGAHLYQAAFVASALLDDGQVLEGLRAEIPDLPVIIALSPEHVHRIPPQALQVAVQTIGKPLALEPVCMMLDRTIELMALRAQLRRQRQAWLRHPALQCDAPTGLAGEALVSFGELLAQKLVPVLPSLEALGNGSLHHMVMSYVEKTLLNIVLQAYRGNQVKSANILGINRNTLRKKVREFGLSFPRGHA